MSLVFAGVDVAGGTTVGLKDHVNLPMYLQQEQHGGGDNTSSSNKAVEEEVEKEKGKERNGFYIEEKVKEESSETSSIGFQSSDSSSVKDGEEDEVQSKAKDGSLVSLDSLEESLPIKRGLSNFFSGKSKSFASLADMAAAATARDLVKPENPFNKRRRLLMASKTRRASYASLVTSLPPLHIAEEKEEEDEEGEQRNGTGETSTLAPLPPYGNKERKLKKAFRSPRSFSLSDLQSV